MKKLFIFLFSIFFILSCNDGDIIVTGFEFDDVDLELCSGSKEMEFVFFKINTENQEAISLNFIGDYIENVVPETPITINLKEDQSGGLIYRQFNVAITNDYYCSNIPSNEIRVTDELIAIEGIATITTEIVADDDNDGIPAEEEDLNGNGDPEDDDTDNDGIPNYKDQDDDDDNILTSAELENGIPDDDSFLDTDGDGTPDYLDNDDDNDGTPTLNEDIDNDGLPGNDDTDNDGIDNYLDADNTESNTMAVPNPDNTEVTTTYRTTVEITNIVLDGNNENFEEKDFSFGFRDIEDERLLPKKIN